MDIWIINISKQLYSARHGKQKNAIFPVKIRARTWLLDIYYEGFSSLVCFIDIGPLWNVDMEKID